MSEDLEKEAQDISQKLGESKNFFDIRKEFLQDIDLNEGKLSYGLAIGYDGKVFSIKRHDDNKDSIIYEVQNKGGARVFSWEHAVNDPELSSKIPETFLPSIRQSFGYLIKASIFNSFKVFIIPKETSTIYLKIHCLSISFFRTKLKYKLPSLLIHLLSLLPLPSLCDLATIIVPCSKLETFLFTKLLVESRSSNLLILFPIKLITTKLT